MKQIGWIATRHAKDIASSDWSVGCETLDCDQARFSVDKDYVGELGAKHGRLQSGWAKCEKQKGVYEFAWLDEGIYGLDEQGVKPWVCLYYGVQHMMSFFDDALKPVGVLKVESESPTSQFRYIENPRFCSPPVSSLWPPASMAC